VREFTKVLAQHQSPLVNDLQPITYGLNFGQDVGGENDAVVSPELSYQLTDFAYLNRVEPDCGLIEDNDGW
jgi:hypothetical protein